MSKQETAQGTGRHKAASRCLTTPSTALHKPTGASSETTLSGAGSTHPTNDLGQC